MKERLLEVENLRTSFMSRDGLIFAVDDISFHVNKSEIFGVVGESGCGKSVTALSIMGLINKSVGRIKARRISFAGENLLEKNAEGMRRIRGKGISMIFQDPMTSLNPVYTIGTQLSDVFITHEGLSRKEAMQKSIKILSLVKIPDPERRIKEYPYQLSGGMNQRVMIALALACSPQLLIADEPTTALDVTIQAQILKLMRDLKEALGMSIIMITHDLGVVAEMADRIAVMYAGKIVEEGNVYEIFQDSRHPYTQGLLSSMLYLGKNVEHLNVIPGSVPRPTAYPQGCRFYPRCKFAKDICRQCEPSFKPGDDIRRVACWIGKDEYV